MASQEPGSREPSYLDHDSTPAQVAALFRAAAALFRARPWARIPDDASALAVTCEALGLRGAAVSVVGQLGDSHGFVCFDSLDDFEQYLDAASDSGSHDGLPEGLPPHIALSLEPGAAIEPSLRKEALKHRWELAAATAYPSIYALDPGPTLRSLTRPEMLRLEVIALALADLAAAAPPGLAEAWGGGGEPVVHAVTVASSDGPVAVTLRAPHEDEQVVEVNPLREERDASGALDPDWYEAHRDFLLDAFDRSPEAGALDERGLAPLFLDLAAQHLDATVLTLTPAHVSRLLELVPRKVSAPPEIAPLMVGEFRALLAFLRRATGGDHLDACLRSLDAAATQRLAHAMTDPRQAGPVKSMLLAGQAAGFDLSTRAGVEAWMASAAAAGSPPPGAAPGPARKAPARKPAGKAPAKASGAKAGKAGGASKGPRKGR